jgi:hypothetical protein
VPSAPLSDLELRIDPEKTIDLFSMIPKVSLVNATSLTTEMQTPDESFLAFVHPHPPVLT